MGKSMRGVFVVIVMLLALPAQAQKAVVWGFEAWTCGTAEFRVRLGSGADVHLHAIRGAFTASSSVDDLASRQSLTGIYPGTYNADASTVTYQTPGTNHSLGPNFANVNMKMVGAGQSVVPVVQEFNPPLLVRGGDLRAVVYTANYNTADNIRCLDTEAQITLVYQ